LPRLLLRFKGSDFADAATEAGGRRISASTVEIEGATFGMAYQEALRVAGASSALLGVHLEDAPGTNAFTASAVRLLTAPFPSR
jgi:hypothetical protein